MQQRMGVERRSLLAKHVFEILATCFVCIPRGPVQHHKPNLNQPRNLCSASRSLQSRRSETRTSTIHTMPSSFFTRIRKGSEAMKEKSLSRRLMGAKNSRPGQSPERSGHVKVFNKQKSVLGRILTVTLNAHAQEYPRRRKKEDEVGKRFGLRV